MNDKLTYIIIPTHNRWERLSCLLKQIEGQILKYDNIKVIVVADGCTDKTLIGLSEEFPNVEIVIGNGTWWFTKSINEGIKYAINFSPDFILTLNDDVELKNDYLEQLFKAINSKNDKCLIGSTSFSAGKTHLLTFSGIKNIIKWRMKHEYYHEYYSNGLYGNLTGIYESITLPTRGLLIPAQIFRNSLYFDESMPQYGSDYDFVFKARKLDYKIFISWDAVIFEYTKLTGQGSPILKESFYKFHKNLFNKYAKNFIKKDLKMIIRHYRTILLPITLSIYFIGLYYTYFKYIFSRKY